MDFNANLLPDDISKYKVSNASINANSLMLFSNANISTTLLKETLNYTPQYFKVYIKYRTSLSIDSYEPKMYVRLTITYADETVRVLVVWMNKNMAVGDDYYVCDTNVLVGDKEIKHYEWSLITEAISDTIEVDQYELRASVDISEALNSAITSQLPSIVLFSNSNTLSVVQNETVGISGALQTSGSTNLLMHLIISGVASTNTTLTISIQINNKEVPYSPLKAFVQAGDFTIGIPGSILQIPMGNNQFAIILSSSAGEARIETNHLYTTLDGKNLIGSYSAEIPRAEVVQYIHYNDIMRNLDVETSVVDVAFEPIVAMASNEYIKFLDVTKMHDFTVLVYPTLTTVAVEEQYYDGIDSDNDTRYEHDEYIILDGTMRFKDSFITTPFKVSHKSTGDIYSLTLDNTSIKKYEAFSIVPKTAVSFTTMPQFTEDNFEYSDFIQLYNGISISTIDTITDNVLTEIDAGKICEVSYDPFKYKSAITIN